VALHQKFETANQNFHTVSTNDFSSPIHEIRNEEFDDICQGISNFTLEVPEEDETIDYTNLFACARISPKDRWMQNSPEFPKRLC